MSTATGNIEVRLPRRALRFGWLVALLVAAVIAVVGTWALVGSREASAPTITTPDDGSVGSVQAPAGWRQGPNGELMPRPFEPVPGSE